MPTRTARQLTGALQRTPAGDGALPLSTMRGKIEFAASSAETTDSTRGGADLRALMADFVLLKQQANTNAQVPHEGSARLSHRFYTTAVYDGCDWAWTQA